MRNDKAICNINKSNNENNSNNHSDSYNIEHNKAHATIVIIIKRICNNNDISDDNKKIKTRKQ